MKILVLALVVLFAVTQISFATEDIRHCKKPAVIENTYNNYSDKEHQVQGGAGLDLIEWQNKNKTISVATEYKATINHGERVGHTFYQVVTVNLWEMVTGK